MKHSLSYSSNNLKPPTPKPLSLTTSRDIASAYDNCLGLLGALNLTIINRPNHPNHPNHRPLPRPKPLRHSPPAGVQRPSIIQWGRGGGTGGIRRCSVGIRRYSVGVRRYSVGIRRYSGGAIGAGQADETGGGGHPSSEREGGTGRRDITTGPFAFDSAIRAASFFIPNFDLAAAPPDTVDNIETVALPVKGTDLSGVQSVTRGA